LDSVVAVRRKEVGHWGGAWGRHEHGTRQRRPKRGHEVSSVAGSRWRGFGRPLGRTGLQARMGWEAGGAARPRLGHTGVGETEAAGQAGLGFQLSFGPQLE
jgi:hypothetical protein